MSFLFFSFYYRIHPISFLKKTIKNDHSIALYEFIIKTSNKNTFLRLINRNEH